MVSHPILVRSTGQDLPHGVDIVLLDSEAQSSVVHHGHGKTLRSNARPNFEEFKALLRGALAHAERDNSVVVVNDNVQLPEGWSTFVAIFADRRDGTPWHMLELPAGF